MFTAGRVYYWPSCVRDKKSEIGNYKINTLTLSLNCPWNTLLFIDCHLTGAFVTPD
jgi:hypothetical protein